MNENKKPQDVKRGIIILVFAFLVGVSVGINVFVHLMNGRNQQLQMENAKLEAALDLMRDRALAIQAKGQGIREQLAEMEAANKSIAEVYDELRRKIETNPSDWDTAE